jgi:hypothetical protein
VSDAAGDAVLLRRIFDATSGLRIRRRDAIGPSARLMLSPVPRFAGQITSRWVSADEAGADRVVRLGDAADAIHLGDERQGVGDPSGGFRAGGDAVLKGKLGLSRGILGLMRKFITAVRGFPQKSADFGKINGWCADRLSRGTRKNLEGGGRKLEGGAGFWRIGASVLGREFTGTCASIAHSINVY